MPKDYSNWTQRNNISVVDMQLDLKNPRMPDYPNLTQADAIAIMSEKYKVLDLAKSIGQRGYIPRENIIIVLENGKPVVLEGNRRVTALKLIINPDLAPPAIRDEYKQIKALFKSTEQLKFPPVTVVPSRSEADLLILDKHTENTEIPWKPIMQSRFYKEKQDEYGGISTKELAEILGTTEKKISDAYIRLSIFDYAVKAVKGTSISSKVEDAESFEITTLERLVLAKDTPKKLRFEISNDSIKPADEARFLAVLRLLVQWMYKAPEGGRRGKITSRSANSTEQIQEYINLAIRTAKEQSASIEPSPVQAENDESKEAENNEPPRVPSNNPTSENNGDVVPAAPKRKINTIKVVRDRPIDVDAKWFGNANASLLDEIYRLSFNTNPTMIVAGTRMLLERSIRRYFSRKNITKISVKISGKDEIKKLEDLKLKQILEYISMHGEEEFDIPNEIIKAINRLSDANHRASVSLHTLNNVLHGERIIAKDSAREIWEQFSLLIEYFACRHDAYEIGNNPQKVE